MKMQWKIGNVEIPNPFVLAPMAGVTDLAFRRLCKEQGAGLICMEMVSAKAISFHNKNTEALMEIDPGEHPVSMQLFGSEPDLMAEVAKSIEERPFDILDINMGCPFPMLAKRHNGSGILPYPEEVQALLSLLITEYPQISFSIKMRLGWEDPKECLKLAPIINELPLRQVVMHPRLGKQQYKGEVDLKAFEAFQGVCKHPLIYNGDINSVEDIHHIQEQFPGLAGMMIGRGLLANPALALEYRQNRTLELDEIREKLQSMHRCVYNQYAEQLEGGDEQLLNKMKTFWEYLMPQADRKLLKAIHKSTSLNKYNQAILAFFNQR